MVPPAHDLILGCLFTLAACASPGDGEIVPEQTALLLASWDTHPWSSHKPGSWGKYKCRRLEDEATPYHRATYVPDEFTVCLKAVTPGEVSLEHIGWYGEHPFVESQSVTLPLPKFLTIQTGGDEAERTSEELLHLAGRKIRCLRRDYEIKDSQWSYQWSIWRSNSVPTSIVRLTWRHTMRSASSSFSIDLLDYGPK